MQPLTTFGTNGDGSLRPNDVPALTATNQFQRGMAYNPTTGHLLVVDRSSQYAGANNDVHIIDGNTGAYIAKLDNGSTLAGGTTGFTLNLIGVARMTVQFMLPTFPAAPRRQIKLESTAGMTNHRLKPLSRQHFHPRRQTIQVAVIRDAIQKRWGDTMTVRGSGLSTPKYFWQIAGIW